MIITRRLQVAPTTHRSARSRSATCGDSDARGEIVAERANRRSIGRFLLLGVLFPVLLAVIFLVLLSVVLLILLAIVLLILLAIVFLVLLTIVFLVLLTIVLLAFILLLVLRGGQVEQRKFGQVAHLVVGFLLLFLAAALVLV